MKSLSDYGEPLCLSRLARSSKAQKVDPVGQTCCGQACFCQIVDLCRMDDNARCAKYFKRPCERTAKINRQQIVSGIGPNCHAAGRGEWLISVAFAFLKSFAAERVGTFPAERVSLGRRQHLPCGRHSFAACCRAGVSDGAQSCVEQSLRQLLRFNRPKSELRYNHIISWRIFSP